MGKIYITRHGETQWNTVRKMQGHNNSPLTDLGVKQALWLANRLKEAVIDVAYSSSLTRALNTAEMIIGNREIEIIATEALKEIYLGSWEGRHIEEVEKEFPEQHRCFWKEPESYVPVDGETFGQLTERVSRFFADVLKKHPNDNVLIVAHAATLKALFNQISNKGNLNTFWEGPHIQPTCLTIMNFEEGQLTIELMADTQHYEETNTTGGWFQDED